MLVGEELSSEYCTQSTRNQGGRTVTAEYTQQTNTTTTNFTNKICFVFSLNLDSFLQIMKSKKMTYELCVRGKKVSSTREDLCLSLNISIVRVTPTVTEEGRKSSVL